MSQVLEVTRAQEERLSQAAHELASLLSDSRGGIEKRIQEAADARDDAEMSRLLERQSKLPFLLRAAEVRKLRAEIDHLESELATLKELEAQREQERFDFALSIKPLLAQADEARARHDEMQALVESAHLSRRQISQEIREAQENLKALITQGSEVTNNV